MFLTYLYFMDFIYKMRREKQVIAEKHLKILLATNFDIKRANNVLISHKKS